MTATAPAQPPAAIRPAPRAPAAERPPRRHYLLLGALLLFLAVLMIYPLLVSVAAAFTDNGRYTGHWFSSILRNHTFRGQLENSLLLACVVTLLCNLIAFPLALVSRHFNFRFKALWSSMVLLPLILPPFVGAIGLRKLLGTFGSLTVLLQRLHLLNPHEGIDWLASGGFWSLAALMTLGLYPIAYLNLQASLANIDPAMLEAAQNLGGTRIRGFFRITLPLAMPGIFAGSTLVFIWAFTDLGTPLMLLYPNVVSRAIWDDVAGTAEGRTSAGFAKVVVVLVISVLVYLIGKTTLGRSGNYAMTSKAAVGSVAKKLRGFKAFLATLPFAAITFLAVLPHIGVLLYSVTAIAIEPAAGPGAPGRFGWYRTILPDRYTLAGFRAVLHTPEIYGAIVNSIQYAACATAVDVFLGIAVAWILVRTRVRGKWLLDGVAMMPLAVPGIVMAFGFIAVILRLNTINPSYWDHITWNVPAFLHIPAAMLLALLEGLWHVAGNLLRGAGHILKATPFWILVIAYSVRRMPYLVRSAAGGLQQTSVTFEEAAANLGAPPWRVLWKITLPLILANLIAGSLLTFAFAMMEVSDSLILAQLPKYYPITKMIDVLGTDTGGPANVRNACALGVVAMIFMGAIILLAGQLLGKKLGALFRA